MGNCQEIVMCIKLRWRSQIGSKNGMIKQGYLVEKVIWNLKLKNKSSQKLQNSLDLNLSSVCLSGDFYNLITKSETAPNY